LSLHDEAAHQRAEQFVHVVLIEVVICSCIGVLLRLRQTKLRVAGLRPSPEESRRHAGAELA